MKAENYIIVYLDCNQPQVAEAHDSCTLSLK